MVCGKKATIILLPITMTALALIGVTCSNCDGEGQVHR